MLCANINNMCNNVRNGVHAFMLESKSLQALDSRTVGFLIASILCLVIPFETTHLLSAIVGVVAYLLLQPRNIQREAPPVVKTRKAPNGNYPHSLQPWASTRPRHVSTTGANNSGAKVFSSRVPQKQEVRQPSAVPVLAPTFQNVGWEAEVTELLSLISPTSMGDAAVAELARTVKRVIQPILPEAEVSGFASGNLLSGGTAFGVAVPEVEIVINVNPVALSKRLQGRWSQNRNHSGGLDALKLQKSAIRACTDRLVGTGNFKFRRSAFRGQEPKVTIIAPSTFGDSEQGIPMNLSVNALTPLYNAILLTECGQIDPRAQQLILLVKRWAKDRGLCHTARGHLSPYTWSLLSIFFLQVGTENGPLVPSLKCFAKSSELMVKGGTAEMPKAATLQPAVTQACLGTNKMTTGVLFKEFVRFYATEFDWRSEAISVRRGKRAPPDLQLPLHIIINPDNGTSEVGPSIEDPFEAAHNLGGCMTVMSLKHLRTELERATELCMNGASLTVLLEPWAPAETHGNAVRDDDECE